MLFHMQYRTQKALPMIKKKKKTVERLKVGDIVKIYIDYQEEIGEEGEAELLEFHRYGGEFKGRRGLTFLTERWKVRFLSTNFVTHRLIRVKNYKYDNAGFKKHVQR